MFEFENMKGNAMFTYFPSILVAACTSNQLQEYRQQVVAPLACDMEVDCDVVEHFLRSLGYDESKLRSDVEAYRIEAAKSVRFAPA